MRCSGNLSNAVKLKHIDYWVSVSELSLNLGVSSQSSFESPHRFSPFTNTRTVLLADEISQSVPFKGICRSLAEETILAKVEAVMLWNTSFPKILAIAILNQPAKFCILEFFIKCPFLSVSL